MRDLRHERVVASRASALGKTRRLARAALRRGLPEWQRAELEREIARHEATLREEKRSYRGRKDPERRGMSSGVHGRAYARGYRFLVVGLVPKVWRRGPPPIGKQYMKRSYVVGRSNDPYDAAMQLYQRVEETKRSGAYGSGRWDYVVMDRGVGGKSKLSVVRSYEDLLAEAKRGGIRLLDPRRRGGPRR